MTDSPPAPSQLQRDPDGKPSAALAAALGLGAEEISGKGLKAFTESNCHNFHLGDDRFNRMLSQKFST